MITAEQRSAWTRVPVDEVGYLSSIELLAQPDNVLRSLVNGVMCQRLAGWRNHDGGWQALLDLGHATGKQVLDYGCGIGAEALAYARAGARVSLTDISEANVALAERVLGLYGFTPQRCWVLGKDASPESPVFDVVHASGVIHHIPQPRPAVRQIARWLPPGGQLRLMAYSDAGWRLVTGTEPPADVTDHPQRERFVRFFDEVGDWADWYDAARLRKRFGCWFTIAKVRYITPDRRYLTAVLHRKG